MTEYAPEGVGGCAERPRRARHCMGTEARTIIGDKEPVKGSGLFREHFSSRALRLGGALTPSSDTDAAVARLQSGISYPIAITKLPVLFWPFAGSLWTSVSP